MKQAGFPLIIKQTKMKKMFSFMNQPSKKIAGLLFILLLPGFTQPVFAAGPPGESLFNNALALILVVLMIVLLIIIGVLANILVGLADLKVKKQKSKSGAGTIIPVLMAMLLSGTSLFAQNTGGTAGTTSPASSTIGGIDATTFYIMVGVIFVELATIIALLVNIKFILKEEKEKLLTPEAKTIVLEEKKSRLSWWDRFNKLRPVAQEAELDLGHDYDGIRELNNKLPPWWLYGFYLTILFAVIYLWRYHVSHTAPLSAQEYERSVQLADARVGNYLKAKGENIDETSVTLLTKPEDLQAGKEIFTRDGLCGTCHGKDGSGIVGGVNAVGPNLTDDYWIHGGNIKDLFKVIKYGVSGKGMIEWGSRFSPKEIAQIASYVKSLNGTNPPAHKAPDGQLYKEETAPEKPVADSNKTKPVADTTKIKPNKPT
jgi:cytochrome c oxidase cbb3-type subunit 3